MLGDGEDGRLGSSDCLLVASDSDIGNALAGIFVSVNVDLSSCLILDAVDCRSGFANNASDSFSWNRESQRLPRLSLESGSLEQFRLGRRDTLAATSYGNLVGFRAVFRLFTILVVSREGQLNAVLLFETDSVFASGTDESGLNGARDLDDLRGLVLELLDLGIESVLGLLDGFFSANNLPSAST